jgi:hypothetical protein
MGPGQWITKTHQVTPEETRNWRFSGNPQGLLPKFISTHSGYQEFNGTGKWGKNLSFT